MPEQDTRAMHPSIIGGGLFYGILILLWGLRFKILFWYYGDMDLRLRLRELIVDYLEEQKLMQLATVSRGSPWVCSVWQAFDAQLNIYFFSSVTRRHSKEIENHAKVAGALALPHTPEDKPRGLQFEGTVEKLADAEDVKKARSLYEGRIFDAQAIDNFMNHKERPHAFYKITPTKFVLFDAENYPEDPRQEFTL